MKWHFAIILVFACLQFDYVNAQNRNNVWCFGDSAGINFNQSIAQPVYSSVISRGSSCSISDSLGTLQFYAHTCNRDLYPFYDQLGVIKNKMNLKMQSGDSIIGGAWYQELIIVPKPNSDSLFYLFNLDPGANYYGFYYALIDLSQNNGLGQVLYKDSALNQTRCAEGISAVKHANGNDWWVMIRTRDTNTSVFYTYLITDSGISNPIIQFVGSSNVASTCRIKFSPDGTKMAFCNNMNLLEIYNFDRCTGMLNSPITITPNTPFTGNTYWGIEFSPNGNLLYASIAQPTMMVQYNLASANIALSRIVIDSIPNPQLFGGMLARAPDNKIYWSIFYYDGLGIGFPFPDSVRNIYNENLSVINNPDSVGLACSFTAFSFHLGGYRTYIGLPNNPEYDLGPMPGNPCGVGLQTNSNKDDLISIYPNPIEDLLVIRFSLFDSDEIKITIADVTGKIIYKTISEATEKTIVNTKNFAEGVYIIHFQSNELSETRKVIVAR